MARHSRLKESWILIITVIFLFQLIESSLLRKPPPFYQVQIFNDVLHEETDDNNKHTNNDERMVTKTKIMPEATEQKQNHSVVTTTPNSIALPKKYDNNSNKYYDADIGLDSNSSFIQYKNEMRASHYGKATMKELRGNRRAEHEQKWKLANDWTVMEERKMQLDNGLTESRNSQKKLVCYYNVPTFQDRPFAIFPEQIDPHLCTHIIVGFAHIVNSTIQPSSLRDSEFYNRTVALKNKNKDLKVMVSVGGAGNNNGFPQMVALNTTRMSFIENSLEFLKTYSFDGIDFDWEFPGWDGPLEEKEQLLQFFQEYRDYTEKIGHRVILTAAVPSPKAVIDLSYDIPKMANILDFINLMTYDFHFYAWYTPFTGPNSPLFKSSDDIGIFATLNTAWSAKYWYQNGMPAHKIVVGVPTYGHTYKLVDPREGTGYNDLAMDIGSVGSRGYISYPEICQFLDTNGTTLIFDNDTRVPYTFHDHDWISFDNEQSVREKAEWVNEFDFGGVMVYSINSDDAWKMCKSSQITFPLINKIKEILKSP